MALSFCIESLPQNDDIQDYKRNDGEEEVEESVKPENIDVEIPIVGPDHDQVATFKESQPTLFLWPPAPTASTCMRRRRRWWSCPNQRHPLLG